MKKFLAQLKNIFRASDKDKFAVSLDLSGFWRALVIFFFIALLLIIIFHIYLFWHFNYSSSEAGLADQDSAPGIIDQKMLNKVIADIKTRAENSNSLATTKSSVIDPSR